MTAATVLDLNRLLEVRSSPTLPTEYEEAKAAWKRRDLQTCSEWLNRTPETCVLVRAKKLELRSWIAAALGDYEGQMRLLEQAWPLARASKDKKTCAHILHTWSLLNRDLYRTTETSWDPYFVTTFPWTPEFALQKFHAYRGLAYVEWFEGRWEKSSTYFRVAESACPSSAWYVTLLLDQAVLSDVQGESCQAKIYVSRAAEQASDIDWNSTNGEERLALLWLATYPTHTGFYDQYLKIRTPFDPTLAAAGHDIRLIAMENGALGRALLAQGNLADGIPYLTRAMETWVRIRCRWRAAFCELAISKVSGLLPGYAIALHQELQSPWIERLVAPYLRSSYDLISKLTTSELVVLQEICSGSSNREIGQTLCKSQYTVKNQVKSLCDKLGVSNRIEAVAVALRAGFGPKK